ncbi:MAG: hypothetical protein K0S12_721 [Bacteroidetes bacterium]|jgi:hypothetical protein|nr:hypothetical protein [Bacteroidota bacterium]
MKLNPTVFYLCTLDQRVDIVNYHGEFITRIKYYGFFLNLYLVENYLIEVYYNIHSNTIEQVELLEAKDERLNLYISNVSLAELGM